MTWTRLIKLILLIADQLQILIKRQKKKEITEAKDQALETGDQRNFETVISSGTSVSDSDISVAKYNGLYERAAKKKD